MQTAGLTGVHSYVRPSVQHPNRCHALLSSNPRRSRLTVLLPFQDCAWMRPLNRRMPPAVGHQEKSSRRARSSGRPTISAPCSPTWHR